MTRDELMTLSAANARTEASDESIEFLFRPVNMLELLLRLDFDGMKQKIGEFMSDDSPSRMPFRVRRCYYPEIRRAVGVEEFYRKVKGLA